MDDIKKAFEAVVNFDFVKEVKHCARCGQDHDCICFRRFGSIMEFQHFQDEKPEIKNLPDSQLPEPGYTHWGMCPVMCEPILMIVSEPKHGLWARVKQDVVMASVLFLDIG